MSDYKAFAADRNHSAYYGSRAATAKTVMEDVLSQAAEEFGPGGFEVVGSGVFPGADVVTAWAVCRAKPTPDPAGLARIEQAERLLEDTNRHLASLRRFGEVR